MIDTGVMLAAALSRRGASFALVVRIPAWRFEVCLSNFTIHGGGGSADKGTEPSAGHQRAKGTGLFAPTCFLRPAVGYPLPLATFLARRCALSQSKKKPRARSIYKRPEGEVAAARATSL